MSEERERRPSPDYSGRNVSMRGWIDIFRRNQREEGEALLVVGRDVDHT